MMVTPEPVIEEPPLRVSVPDMKYTPGLSVTGVLPFVVMPLFAHGVMAVYAMRVDPPLQEPEVERPQVAGSVGFAPHNVVRSLSRLEKGLVIGGI
jgi:hypothetical protein